MTDAALLMFIVSVFILLVAIFLFLAIVLFDKRLFAKSSRSWTLGTSQLDKEVFVVNKKFALAAITMLMAVSLAACGGGTRMQVHPTMMDRLRQHLPAMCRR